MGTLVYVRLIGYTAGTLLMLFWIVVIVGYRRQRNFERVFFFLCLALFLFYGGSLLALNAQIYYSQSPPLLTTFAWTVLSAGLCFMPALLIHLHLEYATVCGRMDRPYLKRLALTFCYALVAWFAIRAYPGLALEQGSDFLAPANSFGTFFGLGLAGATAAGALWQLHFARATGDKNERAFHLLTAATLCLCALLVLFVDWLNFLFSPAVTAFAAVALEFLPLPLFAVLIYAVQKHNFLEIGRQTSLLY